MVEIIRPARTEDAPGITRVHINSWRTTYKGIVPDKVLANLSFERRLQMWKNALSNAERKTFEYVVEDKNGRIVGFVDGGPEREGDPIYKGELYAIYLLKEFQGRSLGRRLMLTLVERLVQVGLYSMLLWVLADNPACRFYEAMGGQRVKTKMDTFGNVTLEEVAYGWQDIRPMLMSPEA